MKHVIFIESSLTDKLDYYVDHLQLWSDDYIVVTFEGNPDSITENFTILIVNYPSTTFEYLQKLRSKGILIYVEFNKDKELIKKALAEVKSHITRPYKWARFAEDGEDSLKVTTKGDKRFTPFFMKVDGFTLENYYQLKIKGFEMFGYRSWKDCKGKAPILFEFCDNFTRESVMNDPEWLYLFTDNLNRTSGRNHIDSNSEYLKLYPNDKEWQCYPTMTQAVIRGLNNAYPISTMRDQHGTQLKFEELLEMDDVWNYEVTNVLKALESGKYKGLKCSSRIFGKGKYSRIGDIPELFNCLCKHLKRIGINNTLDKVRFIYDTNRDCYQAFSSLYYLYFQLNISMMYELACLGLTKTFTDVHAHTDNTQARAYAEFLNKVFNQ